VRPVISSSNLAPGTTQREGHAVRVALVIEAVVPT
jgi:hypothetical protein